MADVNKLILVGRLGGDPELKKVNDNHVCQFTVATNERWKDKSGEKQERVEWTTVVVWGAKAENCSKYLKKGREVYVEGKKRTRMYEKDGIKHYMTECVADSVQFLGSKDDQSSDTDYPQRDDDSSASF